ncbi:storkhead-box protein 2-like [Patiria miniata]|uniref:Winged helix Storkhead-box1 domain-containing protein n=1 Tax=Patiria miniata TaxID=46514 RepID=A0A914AAV2_PATMI|nr:storkhead-box protein 2-like [Patiria miniata]
MAIAQYNQLTILNEFSLLDSFPGDVQGVEMAPIQQHQFIPLTEVLCLIISEMNKRKLMATPDTIRDKLAECYSKMPVPNPEIIHKSLNHLLVERKIEQNGNGKGYMIVGLDKLPPESPSGDELEHVVTKPKSKPVQQQQQQQQGDRVYLVYKDGELTRHALPASSNMVDKSTQTVRSRSDSSSPRPVSYPANPNMGTIYEKSHTIGTSSPSKQRNVDAQASPLQRSHSMRERRSPARRNNFDRTGSMRAKANELDTGYFTSDSEAKQSCFGRLLGKSAKKKAMAQTNMNHQTFSAQFPPSDIHDPFFNYAHWLGKSPQKVALNSVVASSPKSSSSKDKTKSSGASPSNGMGTSTKKDGAKKVHKDVNHYQVEHGRLTQTAKMLQQKYHDNAQESMPESEQEFLKPTLMYDEKFRTKVVSEQIQPGKNTKKNDKMKHYFTSIQSNKPQQMQPFDGISTENDSEIEMQRRNDIAAEKRRQKLEQLKERRQARIFTAHRAMKESEMVDPMDYPPAGMELPGSQMPSGSAGHPTSPGGGNANDMETPEPIRRQVMVMKRTETVEVKHAGLSPTSGPFPAALQTPKNYNGYRRSEPQANYNDPTEREQYYRDEEIDNYMREEQRKQLVDDMQDPMSSPQRDTNGFSSYPQHQGSQITVDRREGASQMTMAVNPRPISLDNLDNERPPPPPPIRFNSQSDRSPGHQPPVHSVHPSQVYMQSPTGIHPEYPSQIPVHQRVESLSSSTGDSGFNSPRSSLAQGHNNNSPVDQMTYDPLHNRHSTTTGIPVLIKPIPRQTQNDLDNQNIDNSNRMIKSTSNPTHLHSTFGKQVNPADPSVKRKFKSSDTMDAISDTSEKTAYSAMSRRSRLDRPKSFEVIGTV